jgi:carbamoyltransferase
LKKRTYIGLATTFHDPAIAILDASGNVVFAEAAERYLQYKRAPYCEPAPILYLPELLNDYVSPDHDIVIATSWSEKFCRYLNRWADEGIFQLDSIKQLERKFTRSLVDAKTERGLIGELHFAQARAGLSVLIAADRILGHSNIELRRYDHHDCHAVYASFTSGFEDSACLVVDGMGETSASAIYEYHGTMPVEKKRFTGRESIGFFFGLITELCGWDPARGEEWKVMGLASYGRENPRLRMLLDKLWRNDGGRIRAAGEEDIQNAIAEIRHLADEKTDNFQADLAREGQSAFERLMRAQLQETEAQVASPNLVLTGGCALNSTFNGKIVDATGPFRNLYVPSAPADDGNAIGAAMLALYEDNPHEAARKTFQSPYLGKDLSQASLDRIADRESRIVRLGDDVTKRAAECLAEGKLVGWVQGRAEFGPRALGNRSILADPRPAGAKNMINAKVKYREPFRPFAPSILHEHGDQWFENYQASPYMERTLKFRQEVRNRVPAVVHRDGTGRLQSVKREWNERYYDLIENFYALTGVPILLNTSFNIMGKPILHSPEDALLMFYTTGIDVLVIGDCIIEK